MAGLNRPTLRDLPSTPSEQNSLAEYIDSLPEKRGFLGGHGLDPSDPKDIPLIQQMIDATIQGTINESHVKKLMTRNPIAAPIFANALNTQKQYREKSGKIQDVLQGSFQAAESMPSGQQGPERPESYDYEKAINRLNAMGETERADKVAEQWKKVMEARRGRQGLYGGVLYSRDKEGGIVPYSVDENTRQAVQISPPPGTEAMMPVIPTPGIGPGGPGIYNVPSRATVSGGSSQVPGLRPLPTAEEAKTSGSASTAFEMADRLSKYINGKGMVDDKPVTKVEVGPVAGRLLRAKALTGIGELTDSEADVLSIEQNLSNQLLQAMRGAQVGPMEQERFDKSLPRIEQPLALFKANIKTTMQNLETLQRQTATMRPITPAERKPSGDSATTERSAREAAALRALRGK